MNFPGVVNSMFSTRLNLSLRVSHCLYLACVKASRGYLLLELEKDYSISASQTKGKKLKKYMYFFKIKNEFSRQQRAEFDLSNLLTPRRLNIL